MPRNIGTIDQVIRAFLGLAVIAYIGKDGILTADSSLALPAGIYLFATLSFCTVRSTACWASRRSGVWIVRSETVG